jgi:hypothetical protein
MRGWVGGVALLVAVLCTGGARAQDVSARQARVLEGQVRGWLAALLGPRVELDQRPVRLTAQDGRYALEVPVTRSGTLAIDGAPLTAAARPLEGGRWELDDILLPSPLHVAVALPDGQQGVWTLSLRDQQLHAVIDPTLATTSTWDGNLGGYSSLWHGPDGERRSEAGHSVTHAAWQPVGGGRVAVTSETATDTLASSLVKKDGRKVSFSAAHSRVTGHIDALAPEHLEPLLRAALEFVPSDAAITAAPPLLGAGLDVIGDLLAGFGEHVELQDVRLTNGAMNAAARRLELGTQLSATDGRLALRLHLVADGIDSSSIPPGPLHDYLPRHIALSPRLGGMATAGVMAALRGAVGGAEPAAQTMRLLQDGPVTLGIDDLAADFGPATLAGSGEMRVGGPEDVAGQARITMTGLDALIRDARRVPMLKQALPMLIFLKGIGEQQGGATVWVVDYGNRRLTVNGTDLSQLVPGAK